MLGALPVSEGKSFPSPGLTLDLLPWIRETKRSLPMGHGLDISTKESQSQTSAVLMLIQHPRNSQELARLGAHRHLDHHGALLRPGSNAAKLVPNWAPDGTLKSMEENLIEIRGRFANYIYIYINLLLLEN